MKRTMVVMAVAALLVTGSALADDGQILGSGTRSGQIMGSGGRTGDVTTQDDGGLIGSGTRSGQLVGSGGGRTGDVTTQDGGGLIGSGTRSESFDQWLGNGGRAEGYYGSGLAAVLYLLFGI